MNLNEIIDYLAELVPVEKIPINWEPKAYTSEAFNQWASGPAFPGWANDKKTEKEVEIIAKLLQVKRGDSLLDVCCGYGRHALVFAHKYGLKMKGIDISPGLITVAKRLAREKGLDIKYEVRNAINLPWNRVFDYVMIAFNSFSLFSEQDALWVLQGINRSLKQGGRLFLDLDNKPYNCRYGTYTTNWYRWPTGLTLQELYFYKDTSVEVNRDIYFKKDANEAEESILFKRIYTLDEIEALLADNGFKAEQVYGDWDLSPLNETSPKMLIAGMRE